MILYDKHLNYLNIYETRIDNEKLIEYRKKRLEEIKSIIIHIGEDKIEKLLFNSNIIRFGAIDRKTKDGTNFIELTNNQNAIDDYINGKYDLVYPKYIYADISRGGKGIYTDLINDDYTLLFPGGSRQRGEFKSDESIVLSGDLGIIQPLLIDDLLNLDLNEDLYDLEFNNVIKYKKVRQLNNIDLEEANKYEIVRWNKDMEEKLEKSALVLSLLSK